MPKKCGGSALYSRKAAGLTIIPVGHCKAGGTACRHAPQSGSAPKTDASPWLLLALEAGLEILPPDAVKSSVIEGESLDVAPVRSSLARRLGIDIGGPDALSRNAEAVVEMMLGANASELSLAAC